MAGELQSRDEPATLDSLTVHPLPSLKDIAYGLIKDKVSRRPGVEIDITTRAIYNESPCTLSGQLRFFSSFPLDAESGSPDTWTALLGKRPSSVRRSIKL